MKTGAVVKATVETVSGEIENKFEHETSTEHSAFIQTVSGDVKIE
jgi:hypothetical protein